MKTKIIFVVLLFLSFGTLNIQANTTSDYFDNCRKTGSSNYAEGNRIVKDNTSENLLRALKPYYTDTVTFIRTQAYYLTYRKGMEQQDDAQPVVVRLAKGLYDTDSSLRGGIIGYLQAFPLSAFNEESKELIAANLSNPNSPHYDELMLLAGFVGTGSHELLRLSTNTDLSVRQKWNVSLALARLGSEDALQYCVEKVKKASVSSELVAYLLPDLVYICQKAALDYCVELLYSDEKLCRTANPNLSESILCAYPVIELIAPAIVNFPIPVDPRIGIETDNYEKMLQTVRQWFKEHPDYKIKKDSF